MERLEKIKLFLEDKKAENVTVVDLQNSEYFVSYVIVATSLNDRHGESLLNYLKKEFGASEEFLNIDSENGEWIAIDLGDILMHIMIESVRDKYNIEDLLINIKKNHQNSEV